MESKKQLPPFRQRQFAEIARHWDRLGETADNWAVSPFNRLSEEGFLESGEKVWADTFDRLRDLEFTLGEGAALDFGCGPGRFTQAIAKSFESTIGVDISPKMISLANKLNHLGNRCTFAVASRPDLSEFGYCRFSLVFSAFVLQHLPSWLVKGYLNEFFRLLGPNGTLVVQEHIGVDIPLASYLPPKLLSRFRLVLIKTSTRAPTKLWDDYWVLPQRFKRWLIKAGASIVIMDPHVELDGHMQSGWFYARA